MDRVQRTLTSPSDRLRPSSASTAPMSEAPASWTVDGAGTSAPASTSSVSTAAASQQHQQGADGDGASSGSKSAYLAAQPPSERGLGYLMTSWLVLQILLCLIRPEWSASER